MPGQLGRTFEITIMVASALREVRHCAPIDIVVDRKVVVALSGGVGRQAAWIGSKLPLSGGEPLPTPLTQPITGSPQSRDVIEGSRLFTLPVFLSPVAPGWNGNPSAFPELRTLLLPATHVGARTSHRH